jgi:hypothetical protein
MQYIISIITNISCRGDDKCSCRCGQVQDNESTYIHCTVEDPSLHSALPAKVKILEGKPKNNKAKRQKHTLLQDPSGVRDSRTAGAAGYSRWQRQLIK